MLIFFDDFIVDFVFIQRLMFLLTRFSVGKIVIVAK